LYYLKTSGCVAALAAVAYGIVHIALVDVLARFSRVVHLVAGIAYAPIVSDGVLARAVGAHSRVLGALVDV
jgi:hypothetical protein